MITVTTQPPLPILEALESIHAAGLEIVPGSLRWVAHPTKPGLQVATVETRKKVVIEVTKESK